MAPKLSQLISITLSLVLGLPLPARAQTYFSCQSHSSENSRANLVLPQERETQIAVGEQTAKNMTTYLLQGQTDIQGLRQWIKENSLKAKPSPAHCKKNPKDLACYFHYALPMMHQMMRQFLALSFAPTITGSNLGSLNVVGNPRLRLHPGSPFPQPFEPLGPEEFNRAQAELDLFWDGQQLSKEDEEILEFIFDNPVEPEISGVIRDYIHLLKKKSEHTKNNPWLYEQVQKTLKAFEASRKLKTPKERIQAALQIHDSGWVAYRQTRLQISYNLMQVELWKLTSTYRFLVYLPQEKPSLQDVEAGLTKSFRDNQMFLQQVQAAQRDITHFAELDPPKSDDPMFEQKFAARKAMLWLLDNHTFVEQSLKEHPEWCASAEKLRAQIDKKEFTRSSLQTISLAAPLVLLFPPAAVALGSLGTGALLLNAAFAGSELTIDSFAKYNQTYIRYMAHWTPSAEGNLESATNVQEARRAAYGSLLANGLFLGLPLFKTGALKNLWTAQGH